MTDDLNSVIEAKAETAGFEFVPVANAFLDHEVCETEPYFNEAHVFSNQEYTYHPNVKGQIAYKNTVRDYLITHP